MERKSVLQQPQPVIVIDLFPEVLNELLRLLAGLSAEELVCESGIGRFFKLNPCHP